MGFVAVPNRTFTCNPPLRQRELGRVSRSKVEAAVQVWQSLGGGWISRKRWESQTRQDTAPSTYYTRELSAFLYLLNKKDPRSYPRCLYSLVKFVVAASGSKRVSHLIPEPLMITRDIDQNRIVMRCDHYTR